MVSWKRKYEDFVVIVRLKGKREAAALGLMREIGDGGNGISRLAPSERTGSSAASI